MYAFVKSTLMDPFRPLLKKNSEFAWSQDLQKAFDKAKLDIVALIKEGLKSFTLGAWTCVVTDWSQTGLGYVLWQKRCTCPTIHHNCCQGGWAMIQCGSRFCTGAESRYHPIKGELLGVPWALEKTAHYNLGCDKLLILFDHKPLLGLLTNRDLGDIENPRLQHLAERIIKWKFEIRHIAGAKNHGPDALSRSSSTPQSKALVGNINFVDQQTEDWSNDLEGQVRAAASSRRIMIKSWETVRQAGLSDQNYTDLLHVLQSDADQQLWDKELAEFKPHKDNMNVVDGVSLFKDRIVIPTAIRPRILEALHRAHQRTTGMSLRTSDSVWWPGMTTDI